MRTREGVIVDIVKRKIFPGTVYINNGKIEKIVRSGNKDIKNFILPGFVDSHIHIESSMLTPSRFAEAVVPRGTIATVSDPHEIANVLGVAGVEFMIEDAQSVPLKIYFGAPSCVPATDFESSGARLGSDKIKTLLARDDIKYLSEMMNFPGVIHGNGEVLEKIRLAQRFNKPVDGHAPGLRGKDLETYINSGVQTDHECSTLEEAIEKIEQGMYIQIREGSAARNFENLYKLLELYPEKVMLCSDDMHPDQLMQGHINLLVKKAIEKGIDFFNVVRAATYNPVIFYNLDVGLLQPDDPADFIIVEDFKNFNVIESIINGETVFFENSIKFKANPGNRPNNYFVNTPEEKEIAVKDRGAKINIIDAVDGDLFTGHIKDRPLSENGFLVSDIDRDILKLVVLNRYEKEKPSVGFIHNFGIRKGGMVSTIAHDSHNIIAVGTSDDIIIDLIKWVNNNRGGIAFNNGVDIRGLPLPVAGILTDEPVAIVAEVYHNLENLVKDAGSRLKSPFMTLSFMSLLVIPKLKLGNRGLFDVSRFEFIDLYEE